MGQEGVIFYCLLQKIKKHAFKIHFRSPTIVDSSGGGWQWGVSMVGGGGWGQLMAPVQWVVVVGCSGEKTSKKK